MNARLAASIVFACSGLVAAPFVRGWGFPNFSDTYTIMNNDLHSVIG